MLGSLLEKKLKALKEDKILIVMDDGLAFQGILEDFDKNTVVLNDVYQGSSKEINWSDISEIREESENIEDESSLGFIDWTYVNMKEVYIRVDHISRIWIWAKKEREKEEESKKEAQLYRKPVYKKSHDIPNIGSSYDLPEGW